MHRLAVYREAIFSSGDVISGGVVYGRADRLMPSTAMGAAAWDGIYELKEDILQRYESLSPETKRLFPLDRILLELELRQGAANWEEAAFLAAKRLAMIEPAEFRERMNAPIVREPVLDIADHACESKRTNVPIFRQSVLDIAKYVCEPNPFTGELNAGCELVMSIYRQQIELGSDETATAPADPLLPGWNAELGEYARHGMARHNAIIERRRAE